MLSKNNLISCTVSHLKLNIALEVAAELQQEMNPDLKDSLLLLSERLPKIARQHETKAKVESAPSSSTDNDELAEVFVTSVPQNTPKSELETEPAQTEQEVKVKKHAKPRRERQTVPLKVKLKKNPFTMFAQQPVTPCSLAAHKVEANHQRPPALCRPGA